MKSTTTLFLLFAVLFVGAFIWFFERHADTTEQRTEQERLLLRLDPEQAVHLQVKRGDFELLVQKKGDTWEIQKPTRYRAAQGEVERLLWGLHDMERTDTITAHEQKKRGLRLAEYGLAPPQVELSVGAPPALQVLQLGRTTPFGHETYARLAGRDDIAVCSDSLTNLIPTRVEGLRDRSLFVGTPLDVTRVDLHRADGFLQIALDPVSGGWRLQQPLGARADGRQVRAILDALFDARIDDFIAGPVAEPDSYGVGEGAFEVTLLDDDTREQSLRIGHPVEENTNLVYGKLGDYDAVFTLPAALVETLAVEPTSLRDRHVLALDPSEVAQITVVRDGQSLTLDRGTNGWVITHPVQRPADAGVVGAFLTSWRTLTATAFRDEAPPDDEAYDATVTFGTRTPDGEPVTSPVSVVQVALGAAGEPAVLHIEGEPGAYETSRDLPVHLTADPLAFRSRAVLRLAPEDVLAVTVTRADGVEQSLARDDDGVFQPVAEDVVADQDALGDLLGIVGHLDADRFVGAADGPLDAYGLDAPAVVLSLGLSGDTGIQKTVLVGGDTAGGVYAMIRGDDLVFVVDENVRALLNRDLYGPAPVAAGE